MPIARSRQAIGELLADWRCEQVGWMDDFKQGRAILQFVLPRVDPQGRPVLYRAQFSIAFEPESSIRTRCTGARGLSESRFTEAMRRRGWREHRVLLLWLKAALEAVAEEIVPFEALFLPFFVGADGQTVADVIVPRLHRLATVNADRLLEAKT